MGRDTVSLPDKKLVLEVKCYAKASIKVFCSSTIFWFLYFLSNVLSRIICLDKFLLRLVPVSFAIQFCLCVRPAILFKKRTWRKCFPVNFAKYSRTPFLQNTSGRLLLKFTSGRKVPNVTVFSKHHFSCFIQGIKGIIRKAFNFGYWCFCL